MLPTRRQRERNIIWGEMFGNRGKRRRNMRNPYIVGNWVRGRTHYGRQTLVEYLLDSEEGAFSGHAVGLKGRVTLPAAGSSRQ